MHGNTAAGQCWCLSLSPDRLFLLLEICAQQASSWRLNASPAVVQHFQEAALASLLQEWPNQWLALMNAIATRGFL